MLLEYYSPKMSVKHWPLMYKYMTSPPLLCKVQAPAPLFTGCRSLKCALCLWLARCHSSELCQSSVKRPSFACKQRWYRGDRKRGEEEDGEKCRRGEHMIDFKFCTLRARALRGGGGMRSRERIKERECKREMDTNRISRLRCEA